MKIIKRTSLAILILIAAGYLFISWTLSNKVLFPRISSLDNTKETIKNHWGTTFERIMAELPEPENFTIASVDNLTLKGKYFKKSDSSSCAIVFVHGWGETWAGMLKYVPAFDDCPCDLILYDHRVHGESEGKYATGTIYESKDLLSVTDWVVKQKGFSPEKIGWVGSSWGASTCLIAGASDMDVAFIVADAPFQDWNSAIFERAIRDYGSSVKMVTGGVMTTVGLRAGVNTKEASAILHADKIIEPVLLIHSKADSSTAYLQSVNISKKLNRKSEYYFTDWGNDHVMDVVNNQDQFRELVTAFLEKTRPEFLTNGEK